MEVQLAADKRQKLLSGLGTTPPPGLTYKKLSMRLRLNRWTTAEQRNRSKKHIGVRRK
jgi:hypothetical protein